MVPCCLEHVVFVLEALPSQGSIPVWESVAVGWLFHDFTVRLCRPLR